MAEKSENHITNIDYNSKEINNFQNELWNLKTTIKSKDNNKILIKSLPFKTEYEEFISEEDWKILNFEQQKRVLSGLNIDWWKAVKEYVDQVYKETQKLQAQLTKKE